MRKRVILALVLVLALLASTSCSLIVKDAEVDKQTVIIEAAGKTITKGEVQEQVDYLLDYYESMYYMYGMAFDKTDAATVAEIQTSAIDSLVQDAVLRAKIAEGGYDALSDEEVAEIEEAAQSTYQIYYDSIVASYFAETELTGEELENAIVAKMDELGYPSKDELIENEKLVAAQEKLYDETVKDVAVTDEELMTEYTNRVGSAMGIYQTTPSAYGTDVTNDSTVYYAPAGYRMVKHILVQFGEEDTNAVSDLDSELAAKQDQLATTSASLTSLGSDASADDEATAQSREALTAEKETLTAEVADLEAKLAEAKAKAYAAIEPTIVEIQGKITAGEDFDALMEQYGQDPGMQVSPAKENGYPVSADSTNWVAEFRDGAMALAAIGDVSEPVVSTYGAHIIKYVSDVAEGEVGLDAVREVIEQELLATKQDEAYLEVLNQWVEAANPKIYADRMN